MLNNNNQLKGEVLNIFKNYDSRTYKLYSEYIKANISNKRTNEKIEKRALALYLSSLTKDDLKRLSIVQQCIDTLKKSIETNTLSTIYETHIINMPDTFYSNYISQNASIIGIRNTTGFFGIDEQTQKEFDLHKIEFDCLHKQLLIKEEIMSGQMPIRKNTLSRREVLILANYIGYGSYRDNLLENQQVDNNKVLIKNKEQN